MKRFRPEQLLRDVLADDEVERLRASTLTEMLRAAGLRRQRRAWISGAAGTLAVVMAILVLTHFPVHPPRGSAGPAQPLTRSPVSLIDDEQLLALFPDRPVALVGPPGDQRLLFLDGKEPRLKRGDSR